MVSSIARSTASGSTDTFSVPFPYLDKTHVQVRLNGVLKALGVDYTFTTASTIQITAGNPAAGVIVERKRVTPAEPLTDFSPGNLDTGDLNVGILQPLYLAQEGNDSAADILLRAWFTTNFGNGGTITVGPDGTILIWDASGNVVVGPSASDIEGFSDAAAASAAAAAASATAASGSASSASASATLAQAWATNPEDSPVTPGFFSSLHWAAKALASATSAAAILAAASLPSSPIASSFLQRNAGNTAYDAKTPTEVSTLLAGTQSGTGAAARTIQSKFTERVSVKDFGAVGNGTTDDTTAIANAIASLTAGGELWLPRGTYKVTSQLNIAVSGIRVRGEGRGVTVISSSAAGHTFQVNNGLSYVEFHDFQLTRPVAARPAVSGQDGIHFTNLSERVLIDNVEVSRHWDGIRLGITSFSKVTNNLVTDCYSNGIHATNADGAGGMQWTLINNLCQQCNGWGVLFENPSGAASVGEIINQSTYANKLGGMAFKGLVTGALSGVRILGGFLGQDGNDEIYFDTYSVTANTVRGVFIELAGTSPCGVDLGTAITNTGHGINATSHNAAIAITDNHIIGNAWSGISTAADRCQIVGNNIRLNGAAGLAGELAGITQVAGNVQIVGNSSKGQTFGVFFTTDGPNVMVGNDLSENTGPYGSGVTLTNSVLQDNIPKSGNDLGQRFGTTTNDNARAGNVGEYVESVVAVAGAINLTNNTAVNITSISLTAGDWDIDAIAQFTGATTTTVSSQEASISTTTGTLDYTSGKGIAVTGNNAPYNQIAASSAIGIAIPPVRLSLAATTTVYLVARSIFATSTSKAYGILRARRVR
ncbi:phage tail fiber protein [Mesorhizobium sp. WSM4982]|uniref:phage tail fiber domain-containing protein n=1 Tax=Mesorhizobium sp. WSM4982 TaxID=3038550 RepID=UPI0024155BAD|nr:phage tail fiber protein [Mesorhizobium sp. WSM4982]MDG4856432.1 phage tail fiber protein [Mesorhizobium sp. WSM4982]